MMRHSFGLHCYVYLVILGAIMHATGRSGSLLFVLGLLAFQISLYGHGQATTPPCQTFDWDQLPSNQWVALTTCGKTPRKALHGASALAPDRRTVFFFGADTHENDYDNSVYRFHLTDLRWSRDYQADALADYRLTPEGYPVTTTNRPWAMHAFDGWDYDSQHRRLVLVGNPTHARKAMRLLQKQGKGQTPIRPATWSYDPTAHSWHLIDTETPNLFAGGLVWDPIKKQMIGHDGLQTYHYDPLHQEWTTYLAPSTPGYHLRLVYDTFSHALLSLGNNFRSNQLWSYSSQSVIWKEVTVPTPPLPANGAVFAYNDRRHTLLYIANDSPTLFENPSGKSVTFLYKSQERRWERLSVKSPPLYGMNFLTQYDSTHDVFLHFEKSSFSDELMAVWAFRYDPTSL